VYNFIFLLHFKKQQDVLYQKYVQWLTESVIFKIFWKLADSTLSSFTKLH